jgi:hypothetical protein
MITTAICNSFKRDILRPLSGQASIFNAADTYKFVLIKAGHAGTYDKNFVSVGTPGTGAPSITNVGTDAVSASGTYTLNGQTITLQLDLVADTAVIDTADTSFLNATISADGLVIFDDTTAGKPAIAVYSFGQTITSTFGTFTIDFPAKSDTTSLIRFA